MSDVTQILNAIEDGDPQAAEKLLPMVYEELRKLARAKMAQESPDHTLQATALVHDAYLRLVDVDEAHHWNSRGHFFSAAAEAMRRILVESARRKKRFKYGGGLERKDLEDCDAIIFESPSKLLELDEALMKLESREPAKAELIKLRYFAGFSLDESAKLLGISQATAKRYWSYARAWLFAEISDMENSMNLSK